MPKRALGFVTPEGLPVPTVSADEMLHIDRIAMDEFHIDILQMMENAGRHLAECAIEMLGAAGGSAVVLAGGGGNGGGGLCCARHLINRGYAIAVVLDRSPENLAGAAGRQLSTLKAAGQRIRSPDSVSDLIAGSTLVIDALIGFSLAGSPRGIAENLISAAGNEGVPVLSLDVPSGVDASSGDTPGVFISPARILTLALPKAGLLFSSADIQLADIGIPAAVFSRIGLDVTHLFRKGSRIPMMKPL